MPCRTQSDASDDRTATISHQENTVRIPKSLLIVVLLIVLMLTGFASAQVFTLTDLGSDVSPAGINKYGQVAITTSIGGITHAGIWYRGRSQNLHTLPGAINSAASGINNHGDVVGDSDGEATWWPSPGKGSVTDIGLAITEDNTILGIAQTIIVSGINDARVITGEVGFEAGYSWFVFSPATTAQTFGRGLIDRGEGVAIDNFGNIAGDGDGEAFIWSSSGGEIDTGIPNSSSSAISNGVIAGQAGPSGGFACNIFDETLCSKLFIWSKANGTRFFGQLPGQTFGLSRGINAFRQVVGSSGSRAFFWSPSTGIFDLNRLVKAPGWTLLTATAINDSAQIVGSGTLNGVPHGFLLTVRYGH
jgi:uncharacterized membrane protein